MFQIATAAVKSWILTACAAALLLFPIAETAAQTAATDSSDAKFYEGKPIRDIRFTGKYKLRRYILYREIDSERGKPLDLSLLERDRRKVDGFGIFSRVDTQIIPAGDSVDIEFDLREVWTLLPMIAVGRTEGKLDWSAGVHERNLLGFYLQAVILYRRFEERNSLHITTSFPRFLGKDLAVGFAAAEQNELDPLTFHGITYEYDYLRKAISGSVGHRLSEKLFVVGSVGYDRENWKLNSPDTLGIAISMLDYPRYFLGAGSTLGRVYYDRYFYDGTDLSGDGSLINERPGGKFNKWRFSLTARRYRIVGPLNFAMRLRYQVSSSDERVQPYAISGETNVRGFRDKVERGDFALIGNFETRWRTLNTRVFYGQLVAFADAGAIWGRGNPFEDAIGNPYWSIGAGIRGSIKQFLGRVGRIDVALNPRDGTLSLYLSTSQFF